MLEMKRLAIVTTHPIQYYAPVFAMLHQRGNIIINVFYTCGENNSGKYDPGFKREIEWDIPLLQGYPYEWQKNTSEEPGSHHFNGVSNPDLISRILMFKPDAVLVFGWAWRSHLKAMRYFKNRVPVYFRGDSTLLSGPRGLKKYCRLLFLRWVYKHADHAFYTGKNNKAYFLKFGLNEAQLSFAPHAVDNARFEKKKAAGAADLRLTLNLSNDDILILYAGKFDAVKNVKLLLNAFIKLNYKTTHLLLVGSGIEEDELKASASNFCISNKVHFMGFQNQTYMPLLYQAADLFCLPSVSESWGLAVNEAMACGKGVLVSDKVGCAADLVRNNYNGHIFKSNNLEELTFCLKKLTASKKLLACYGQNSLQIIKDWNFAAIAEAIENKLINETH